LSGKKKNSNFYNPKKIEEIENELKMDRSCEWDLKALSDEELASIVISYAKLDK